MLASLRIKNLALIEELTWSPGTGFNTLTGETGAGKSILIDGLMLLAGERADKSLIRTGATVCLVEAEIHLSPRILARVSAVIEKMGADPVEDSMLILKRSVQTSGANKQFVNGSAVTLQNLKELGDVLVDLHGPHDHQSLLSTDNQLGILDAFGQCEEECAAFGRIHDRCTSLERERDSLHLNERERAEKVERLTRHVREIEDARLQLDEDVQVERDFRLANNARQLLEHASAVNQLINEGEVTVLSLLAQVERQLTQWQKIDPQAADLAEMSHGAARQLQELAGAAQDYAERVNLDSERMHQLEQRLDLLNNLKRKYGPTLTDVKNYGETCARDLSMINSGEATLQEILRMLEEARAELREAGQRLTRRRIQEAAPLAKKIQEQLRELGFKQAQFAIACQVSPVPSRTGYDTCEFIFAPNPGEAPQPLREIASSGEMARVMLAVKTTLAEVDQIPVLVFDEVDANVGGETAWQVGSKLRRLGQTHQVLCITHQPMVAAQGEKHFAVNKETVGERTVTRLLELQGKTRAREIARMLGGENKESMALAQKMIDGQRSGQ